jgi:hypothetical protein
MESMESREFMESMESTLAKKKFGHFVGQESSSDFCQIFVRHVSWKNLAWILVRFLSDFVLVKSGTNLTLFLCKIFIRFFKDKSDENLTKI